MLNIERIRFNSERAVYYLTLMSFLFTKEKTVLNYTGVELASRIM